MCRLAIGTVVIKATKSWFTRDPARGNLGGDPCLFHSVHAFSTSPRIWPTFNRWRSWNFRRKFSGVNICFYIPTGEVFTPLRTELQEVGGVAAVDLSSLTPAEWRPAIARADRIWVDVTGNDPIAFLCLGLAWENLNKVTLLNAAHLPLPDLFERIPMIVHGWNIEYVRSKLNALPVQGADSVSEPAQRDKSPMGQFQRIFGDLLRKHRYEHRGPVEFDGRVFTLREQEMELALVQEIANRARSLNLRVRLL